jgi:hypothetical protein
LSQTQRDGLMRPVLLGLQQLQRLGREFAAKA